MCIEVFFISKRGGMKNKDFIDIEGYSAVFKFRDVLCIHAQEFIFF